MRQNLSLVTLGVSDLERSRKFYEALGWKEAPGSSEDVVFYALQGMILGLFPRKNLATDAHVAPDGSGFPGFSLAINMSSENDVDAVFVEAKKIGATVTKMPEKVFWGGYSGYFTDPDGFLWEIAHNPFWTLDDKGRVFIPETDNAAG